MWECSTYTSYGKFMQYFSTEELREGSIWVDGGMLKWILKK
jgi:hypothetical protein